MVEVYFYSLVMLLLALVSDDRSCIIALGIDFGSTVPHERSLFACPTEAACGSHSGMDDATGRQIFA